MVVVVVVMMMILVEMKALKLLLSCMLLDVT